jgi:Fic family protein
MNDTSREPDDFAQEIAAADSLYEGFPDFSSWAQGTVQAELWDRAISTLTSERASASPEDFRAALDVAMRAAAIDTGAIEGLYEVDRGFTMTVATQTTAWQAQLAERGDNVPDLFQAQLTTYELVLDAATNDVPITEAWIRRIHEEVCKFQKTYRVQTPIGVQEHELVKGQYKTQPNHVRLADGSIHAYAPVHETAPEMARLVDNISSEGFRNAHPVLQASYVHHALTVVHPFADGNGRVARAVASTFYYRAASIPLLIFADQRPRYLAALQNADASNFQPFINFIFQRGLSAMDLVSESLKTAKSPAPEGLMKRLRGALTAQGGLTHQELDQVAHRLVTLVHDEFTSQISSLDLPIGVTGAASYQSGSPAEHSQFRMIVGGARYVHVAFNSQEPAQATASAAFVVLVSRSRDESESFLLTRSDGEEAISFSLHDIYPDESTAAAIRISGFVRRNLGQLVTMLLEAAQQSLRSAGYA